MRTVVKNNEFNEASKIVQERIMFDDVEKKYYHERYENGRKVQEWVTEELRK